MIRLEKRLTTPWWINWTVPIGSILAALIAGSFLILSSGNNPLDTYSRIVDRAFTSSGALSATLIAATPLLFTGLCAAVAFRMGIFNIGGEGQFVMGTIAAAGVGLAVGHHGWIAIPLMIAAGAVAGGLWAAIVGVLRAWFRTNEIISSLMLNYVALNVAYYLIFNSRSYWRLLTGAGAVFPQGRRLDQAAAWPRLPLGFVNVPFGFLVGIGCAILLWIIYRSTRFGFEIKVIADSPSTAEYAGMRTKRTIMAVMVLSGAIAGIGGASDIGDIRYVLDPKGLAQAAYGYAGIVVAALARLNPVAVVFTSILMGALSNAGRALQGPGFPAGLVGTLQGLLLFFALGGEILARYRIRTTRTVPAGADT